MQVADGWLQWAWWPLLAWILWGAPWRWLLRNGNLNRLLVCAAVQFLIWQIRTDILGLNLHLLGATVMTLMFGWRLAILGGSLAIGLNLLRWHPPMAAAITDAWVTVVLPVAVSYLLARGVERCLPRNFFIYVYASAFLGGALSMLAMGTATVLLLPTAVPYGDEWFARLMPYVLMMFGEAFVSGALITLMVAYRPSWVASFDDRRYLAGR
ncbi:MAG: energy-coupling factor ABC transporter permease [Gammaproteobacteria bacterium]